MDVLCVEYPEPFCETVEDRILLKRELIHLYASEEEEKNEVSLLQLHINLGSINANKRIPLVISRWLVASVK